MSADQVGLADTVHSQVFGLLSVSKRVTVTCTWQIASQTSPHGVKMLKQVF